jgi:type VI secretion system protein ImpM
VPGAALGLFGKLPGHGDFVRRGLPASFVDPLDAWLRQGLGASRERLGEGWLELYLVMPPWRFAIAAEVCGPGAAAGVMIPSVDRVGRYYPFTLAALLDPAPSPLALHRAAAWLDDLEALALAALEDGLELETYLERLATVRPPSAPAAASVVRGAPEALAERLALPWSLWWTRGGAGRVGPGSVAARGMPPAATFAAFMDDDWRAAGVVEDAA